MHLPRRLQLIRTFAVLGILISLFLTFQSYQEDKNSWCVLGTYFDCALLESPYATLDGIFYFLTVDAGLSVPLYSLPLPNSLLFFLLFLFVFVASLNIHAGRVTYGMGPRKAAFVAKCLLYAAGVYVIYLTYVETYLLYSFCLLCAALTVLIFILLLLFIDLHLSFRSVLKRKRRTKR